jgi:hypothetical protein
MGFSLHQWVTYKPDAKLFLASFCLSVATFVVYLRYFDILAPVIPDGSVRASAGDFFAIPVFILVGGQTLIAMWLVHFSIALASPENRDALRAYFVSAFQILLFSGYYVIFPHYGAYIYIVYWIHGENFGTFAYPILILWTLAIVLGTYLATLWAFKVDGSRFGTTKRLLLAAGVLSMMIVIAS